MLNGILKRKAADGTAGGTGFFLPVRARYVFTRRGGLRLRYLVSPVAGFLAVFALSLATMPGSQAPGVRYAAVIDPAGGIEGGLETALAALPEAGAAKSVPAEMLAARKPLRPRTETFEIARGETLAGVLRKAGLSGGEAYDAVESLRPYIDPRDIRAGQKLQLRFDPGGARDGYNVSSLRLPISPLKSVTLTREGDGGFEPSVTEKKPERRVYAQKTVIELSVYGSALKTGIPSAVVAEAIRIFSWDVDFQRDIRRGDVLEVMYDQMEAPGGERVAAGDILYAMLHVGGQDVPVYRYTTDDGDTDYFTADGVSLKKTLMKTPIDGARLSSGFGMRRHPVLGYNKMHKGLDFAASTGTPIYAAGDGTVEMASPWKSYGNYVRIRHNSSLKTAYAHMQRFAPGVAAGRRVKQGQVIGYVGTTGRSTGPHLHYEVIVGGAQVNPKSVGVPQGETLRGKELAAFKRHVEKTDRQYAALRNGDKYAALETGRSVLR